jgi:amidophosphoribosyltransferase
MGVTDYFELMPGTIAKISDKGLIILAKQHERQRALCIFENIYLQHGAGKAHMPRSSIRAVKRSPTIDDVRRRSGKILAREAPISLREVNMVIGVPGTGIEGGMTYARALDLPYFQAITDKSVSLTEQRTFMTADIDSIYQKVLEHFCFDAQALHGRRVVLVDDSIVRGNITRGLIYLLKHYYGVIDVHLRIVSPPIDKACHLGVNTRSSKELIAARLNGDVERIRIELGAKSLAYLSAEGLREAITGDPKTRGFCMGCMAGHQPPVDINGNTVVQKSKRIKIIKDILPKNIYEHPQGFVY